MIAAIISILSIVILGAGCIYFALGIRDAKDDLYTANHLKKLYKECLDKKEIDVVELEQLVLNGSKREDVLSDLTDQSSNLLNRIREELENGVFYDELNNTIVIITNLKKIGDF